MIHRFTSSGYAFLFLTLVFSGCRPAGDVPDPDSRQYEQAVSSFYVGLAAIQAGADRHGRDRLTHVTQVAPGEPAAWANLGLLSLRQREYEEAETQLARARELAPDNAHIQMLSGLLESNLGRFDRSISFLERAIALDAANQKALFALAQEVERQATPGADDRAQQLMEQLLETSPENLAVLLERARLAAKRDDRELLDETVSRIGDLDEDWPEEVRDQFRELETAAGAADLRLAGTRVAFLRNVLVQTVQFRQDLAAIQTPIEEVGELMLHFVRMPSPRPHPASPDTATNFTQSRLYDTEDIAWLGASPVSLTGEDTPQAVFVNEHEIRTRAGTAYRFQRRPPVAPTANGILSLDFDYDFLTDLALAGPGGFKLLRQTETGNFVDVTQLTEIPTSIVNGSYTGLWAADVDLDGDLDVVLMARNGPVTVLRNNADGTFTPMAPFPGAANIRDFAWADLDGDGAADAVMVDADGQMIVWKNHRGGQFRERNLPDTLETVVSIGAADVSGNGLLDIVAVTATGIVFRLSDVMEGQAWETAELARWPQTTGFAADGTDLFVGDLDNNGGLDIVVSTTSESRVWLSDEWGNFLPVESSLPARIHGLADLTGNGRLDLFGLDAQNQAVLAVNQGLKNYSYQIIRPRGARSIGDQRINSFGVGGEMEVRAGLLYQKQPISGPIVHFGLGEHALSDVVRIIWPNGSVQAEFDLVADQTLLTEQRLKGSCPFVFTFDGEGMQFVTDFLWRSPLGLAINAQEAAGVVQTEDWIRIPGDLLAEKDGYYDIRISADLWETHFFDHMSLKVIDHPVGTEVFVDERFSIPPPELAAHITGPAQPITRVWDDFGNDVTEIVSRVDQHYLDFAGRGQYQGVTRDHYVEIQFGEEVPADSVWLIGFGWVRPTDSSINVALSQGDHPEPRGLSMEVLGSDGEWRFVRDDIGFPAGKTKTILIDLDGLFDANADRRIRLHTNLEIYWDALKWAPKLPDVPVRSQRLLPDSAEVRYRGFNVMYEESPSSPELALYEIEGTSQRWRDLIGYYTQYGDVRELVEFVDDRYVIMNAGDELLLKFKAPPPPPEGWVRDFVLIGVGWNKDGDYNTSFSKTVLPLPSHDRPNYDTPPGRLEDDPVYKRFPEDWQKYHTRYVTPDRFVNALRPRLEQ